MNRFFKILTCIFIVLSVVVLVLFCMFAYGMATRGNSPKYESGSVWFNEETGITLTANDDGILQGKNVICDKEYDLTVGHRAGSIFVDYIDHDTLFDEEGYVTKTLFMGDFKCKKDKFIIRNIDYFENVVIGEDKLIFVKQ